VKASSAGWTFTAGLSVACWASACRGNAAPPSDAVNPERTALVAQPCAGLELGSAEVDPGSARVFVEVVEVSASELPKPIGRWLEENAVKVRSTANLVAFPNVPTSMPWGQCVDAVCASMQRSITLTARLPVHTSKPIGLALRIEEAAPEGSTAGAKLLLDTTLEAVHQEPVVLPPAPAVSSGSLIVTSYLLQRHDDLQRVMECSSRQREREKELAQ